MKISRADILAIVFAVFSALVVFCSLVKTSKAQSWPKRDVKVIYLSGGDEAHAEQKLQPLLNQGYSIKAASACGDGHCIYLEREGFGG